MRTRTLARLALAGAAVAGALTVPTTAAIADDDWAPGPFGHHHGGYGSPQFPQVPQVPQFPQTPQIPQTPGTGVDRPVPPEYATQTECAAAGEVLVRSGRITSYNCVPEFYRYWRLITQ